MNDERDTGSTHAVPGPSPVRTDGALHRRPVEGLLFDLDGTLVHSLPDITDAINAALRSQGAQEMSMDQVRARLGRGAAAILAPALGESDLEAERVLRAVATFMEHYRANLVERTRPRAGAREVLAHFRTIPRIVVSNKPRVLAQGIVRALEMDKHIMAVFGGDSFPRKKPDPTPILEVVRRFRLTPSRTVLVGDSPVDVQAGKAAGILTCAVLGGYADPEALAREAPDLIVPNLPALIDALVPVPPRSATRGAP